MNTHEDRNETIKAIRDALKRRSGKSWSVTGGRGRTWGWIRIDAPPTRRIFKRRERTDIDRKTAFSLPWRERFEQYNCGEPGHLTSDAERVELAKLLGLPETEQTPINIPARYDYRKEYIDRAQGKTPSVIGQRYWD